MSSLGSATTTPETDVPGTSMAWRENCPTKSRICGGVVYLDYRRAQGRADENVGIHDDPEHARHLTTPK